MGRREEGGTSGKREGGRERKEGKGEGREEEKEGREGGKDRPGRDGG